MSSDGVVVRAGNELQCKRNFCKKGSRKTHESVTRETYLTHLRQRLRQLMLQL